MSYILESLKKSDQERQSNAAATVAVSPEAILLAPRQYSWVRMWVAMIVIVIIVAFIFIWFFVGKEPPHGFDDMVKVEMHAENESASRVTKAIDTTPLDGVAGSPIAVNDAPVVPTPEDVVADALYEQQVSLPDDEVLSLYQSNSRDESPIPLNENVASKQDEIEPVLTRVKSLDVSEVTVDSIPEIYDLDRSTQRAIPAISYGAHIYATDKVSGFVILNGAKRKVGEKMRSGIYIEQVNEHEVVLSYQGLVFSLPAMKSWIP
jgi:hypothetical protein